MFTGAPGSRRTFVVEVHADGPATVENLLTRERAVIPAMSSLGQQIEAWLAAPERPDTAPTTEEGGDPE